MTADPRERLVVDALPGYEPEIGRLLRMLEETRQRTKASLDDLADDDLDWSPAPGYNSIGTILYHLAAVDADWLYTEVLEQPFPPEAEVLLPNDMRDDGGHLTIARGSTLDAYIDRLDAVRSHVLASFRDMSLAEFRRERNLPDYDVTPEYVLHHLMRHEAEHQGEIGMLHTLIAAERGIIAD